MGIDKSSHLREPLWHALSLENGRDWKGKLFLFDI